MKLIGIVFIILAGTLMGMSAAYNLKKSVQQLQLFYEAVAFIGQEIRYNGLPILEIFEKITQNFKFQEMFVFQAMLQNTRDSNGFFSGEIADDALTHYVHPILSNSEKQLLLNFFQNLGNSDAEGQAELCRETRQQLFDLLQVKKTEMKAKGKLYLSLGILGGLFFAIILS